MIHIFISAPDSNQSLVTNDNVEDASSRIPLEREKRKSDRLTAYACENSRFDFDKFPKLIRQSFRGISVNNFDLILQT